MEVGTKIQLYQKENSKTVIAFLTHLLMPTGTIEISNNLYGSISKLSISHQFNDRVGLGYNLGYNYFGEGKTELENKKEQVEKLRAIVNKNKNITLLYAAKDEDYNNAVVLKEYLKNQ